MNPASWFVSMKLLQYFGLDSINNSNCKVLHAMSERDDNVTCTLTEKQRARREADIRRSLLDHYRHSEGRENGFRLTFDGTEEAMRALADFVSTERRCCSFTEYTIRTAPPYAVTRLSITGPDRTKELFQEFVDILEGSR